MSETTVNKFLFYIGNPTYVTTDITPLTTTSFELTNLPKPWKKNALLFKTVIKLSQYFKVG